MVGVDSWHGGVDLSHPIMQLSAQPACPFGLHLGEISRLAEIVFQVVKLDCPPGKITIARIKTVAEKFNQFVIANTYRGIGRQSPAEIIKRIILEDGTLPEVLVFPLPHQAHQACSIKFVIGRCVCCGNLKARGKNVDGVNRRLNHGPHPVLRLIALPFSLASVPAIRGPVVSASTKRAFCAAAGLCPENRGDVLCRWKRHAHRNFGEARREAGCAGDHAVLQVLPKRRLTHYAASAPARRRAVPTLMVWKGRLFITARMIGSNIVTAHAGFQLGKEGNG